MPETTFVKFDPEILDNTHMFRKAPGQYMFAKVPFHRRLQAKGTWGTVGYQVDQGRKNWKSGFYTVEQGVSQGLYKALPYMRKERDPVPVGRIPPNGNVMRVVGTQLDDAEGPNPHQGHVAGEDAQGPHKPTDPQADAPFTRRATWYNPDPDYKPQRTDRNEYDDPSKVQKNDVQEATSLGSPMDIDEQGYGNTVHEPGEVFAAGPSTSYTLQSEQNALNPLRQRQVDKYAKRQQKRTERKKNKAAEKKAADTQAAISVVTSAYDDHLKGREADKMAKKQPKKRKPRRKVKDIAAPVDKVLNTATPGGEQQLPGLVQSTSSASAPKEVMQKRESEDQKMSKKQKRRVSWEKKQNDKQANTRSSSKRK